jgi:hypothetical protein
MNPLLLKPESDTHSQVVLLGQVRGDLGAMPWRERSNHVWPAITAALDALRAEHDVVVIEGAGSPAEINLADCDVVNLRVARHCNATVPAGHRHRPRRGLCAPLRHLGAAARSRSTAHQRLRAEQVPG